MGIVGLGVRGTKNKHFRVFIAQIENFKINMPLYYIQEQHTYLSLCVFIVGCVWLSYLCVYLAYACTRVCCISGSMTMSGRV
jgi:hypothetical protein